MSFQGNAFADVQPRKWSFLKKTLGNELRSWSISVRDQEIEFSHMKARVNREGNWSFLEMNTVMRDFKIFAVRLREKKTKELKKLDFSIILNICRAERKQRRTKTSFNRRKSGKKYSFFKFNMFNYFVHFTFIQVLFNGLYSLYYFAF